MRTIVTESRVKGGTHPKYASPYWRTISATSRGGRVMAGRPARDRCRAPQADLGSPVTYWQPYGGKYPSSGDSGAPGGVGSGGDPPRLQTWATYGEQLESNLRELADRLLAPR